MSSENEDSIDEDINISYPNPANFLDGIDDKIPPTLILLLKLIVEHPTNKYNFSDVRNNRLQKKIKSLCHAIVHAAKPTAISPLMLGVGSLLYRKYGSKQLINILSSLGFCCSYYDAQLLESSILACPNEPTYDRSYIQTVFDNTDHNTVTVDGTGTFHCMSGSIIIVPHSSVRYDFTIPKLNKIPPMSQFTDTYWVLFHYKHMNLRLIVRA